MVVLVYASGVSACYSPLQNDEGGNQIVAEQLALTEASYTILRILQTFRVIEPADEEPWKENSSITLSCASGCRVRLYRA